MASWSGAHTEKSSYSEELAYTGDTRSTFALHEEVMGQVSNDIQVLELKNVCSEFQLEGPGVSCKVGDFPKHICKKLSLLMPS